jgi:hypothetical protein
MARLDPPDLKAAIAAIDILEADVIVPEVPFRIDI